MTTRVLDLDPATYERHPIHRGNRVWAETNCYVDLWVELAHAFGHEPAAALPFTFAIDFEGDQWTFFKFPFGDLFELFGFDVQELAIWRGVPQHIEEQLARGRPVLLEVDSYFLPDTAGAAYKLSHVKTTVAAVSIDVAAKRLGYFHNAGYFELSGDDFDGVLQVSGTAPEVLPPYTEFVKVRTAADGDGAVVRKSLQMLKRQLALVPESNPFTRFRARLEADLGGVLHDSLETFHRYSFATLRQAGACFELAADYLRWLGAHGEEGLEPIAREFLDIAEAAKTLQFQLARAVARGKPLDLAPLDAMGERWQRGIDALKARYG